MTNAFFNWSGGKDSSMTLYSCLKSKEYDIRYLLTSINEKYQRISMHGVRVELLKKQAEEIGIPLKMLSFPEQHTMEDYERIMKEALEEFVEDDIHHAIFGDIFLEDLRQYREDQLAKMGMKGVFPIWKISTDKLVRDFINDGFKSIIVCVDKRHLDKSFVGREIDEQFIKDLPDGVDPCGENGEFHSFVYDGPIFKRPIAFERGEIVYREYKPSRKDGTHESDDRPSLATGFWYCDLMPEEKKQTTEVTELV